ncbi:MAG: D-glycero-beta-D-manno-heptose-7-phosphate kinase [Roseococcus sp.]
MLDLTGRRVLVLGDVMLDRFLYGEARRLSPEAPVPVVRLGRTEAMAGGAGNVARNVEALGGEARLVALAGEDAAGEELRALLGPAGRLVQSAARVTTVKLRVIAARQQVVRVDEEQPRPADPDEEAALLAALEAELPWAEALVLSDYAKGALTPPLIAAAIAAARARGLPCLVDPKGRDFARYAGADLLTPNAMELAEAAGQPAGGDAACEAAARALLARLDVPAILATRSEKGMMLVPREGPALSIPAMAREVFDVSGAGDTVIATLALCRAAGLAWPEAMRAANAAAGVVVGKLGTATCSAAELDHALRELEGATGELLSWPAARRLVEGWRAEGLRVGFANGCFDLLHAGHVRLLREARRHCDRLIVALNEDASVARLKGPGRPVNPLADRAAVIAALASVDAVVGFAEDTPLDCILALRPDVLFKGQDYTLEQVVGAREVASWGGETVLLPLLPGRSSSAILARGRAGG